MNTKTDALKPIKEHLDLLSVEIHGKGIDFLS